MIKKALKALITKTAKIDTEIENSIQGIVKFQKRVREQSHRLKSRKG